MKYCCCGCSIKFGTLLILWMRTLFLGFWLYIAISDVRLYGTKLHNCLTLYIIIEITVAILGIFAVHNKKPILLLPYYWSQVIDLIFISLSIIAYLMLSIKITTIINDYLDGNIPSSILGDIIIFALDISEGCFLLIFVIQFVVQWYFAIVIYSCYRFLRRKKLKSKVAPEHVAPISTVPMVIPVFYPAEQQSKNDGQRIPMESFV